MPQGHWKTTTFVAGLRLTGFDATMLLGGPWNGEGFRAYIAHVPVPELTPGDVAVMENLPAHKVDGVRQAIEAAGARILYLPPYSPDFNPIEMAFSNLKVLLRQAAKRTVEGLWHAVAEALKAFTPQECAKMLAHAGYDLDYS